MSLFQSPSGSQALLADGDVLEDEGISLVSIPIGKSGPFSLHERHATAYVLLVSIPIGKSGPFSLKSSALYVPVSGLVSIPIGKSGPFSLKLQSGTL